MSDRDRVIIDKMIKYCQDSIKYVSGLSFEEFSSSELYLTFSIFALSQLGELVPRLGEDVRNRYIEIPWNAIRSLRNKIVHEYDGIQYRVVWDTLTGDIPALIRHLQSIKGSDSL